MRTSQIKIIKPIKPVITGLYTFLLLIFLSHNSACTAKRTRTRKDVILISDTSRRGDTVSTSYYFDTVSHERVGIFKITTVKETKTRFMRYYNMVVTDSTGLKMKDGHCIYLTKDTSNQLDLFYMAVEADSFDILQHTSRVGRKKVNRQMGPDSIGFYYVPKRGNRYTVRVWISGVLFEEGVYWKKAGNGKYGPVLKPFRTYIRGIGYSD